MNAKLLKNRLRRASVLFATFSLWTGGKRMPTNGSVEPLRDFLVPKIQRLVMLDQLVPGSESVLVRYEEYKNHMSMPIQHKAPLWMRLFSPLLKLWNTNGTHVAFKVRDFFSVIDWAMRDHSQFSFFIGLESINTLAGICLRKVGRVKKVIYYVSDYAPNRYGNRIFNWVYLWLDRYCAVHADFIWDVSSAMQAARVEAGLDAKASAPVIVVNNGVFEDQLVVARRSSVEPHAIAYMGTLGPENGPDIAIGALAQLKKRFKDASLIVIGGKPKDAVWLQKLARKYAIQKHVRFYGFVPSADQMARLMSVCRVGVAPYRSFVGSARWYGDAGKIRAYCAAGLPVVSSQVPPLGAVIARFGAGVVVQDTVSDFVSAIDKIFTDNKHYNALRSRALVYAKRNTWEKQFSYAFSKLYTKI